MGSNAQRVGFAMLVLGLAVGIVTGWMTEVQPSVAQQRQVRAFAISTAGEMVWRLETTTGRLEICKADAGWANTGREALPRIPLAGVCVAMPTPFGE